MEAWRGDILSALHYIIAPASPTCIHTQWLPCVTCPEQLGPQMLSAQRGKGGVALDLLTNMWTV